MTAVPGMNAAVAKGEAALNNLYALQIAAAKAGDAAMIASLNDRIDELVYRIDQLRDQAIAADAVRIAVLNAELDKVTTGARTAIADFGKLDDVIKDVVAVVNLIDAIVTAS